MNPPALLFFVLLLMVAYVVEPGSFVMAWNQGRSGILVVIPLAALEMGRRALKPISKRRTSLMAYSLLLASLAYYVAASSPGFRSIMASWGIWLGIDPLIARFSWVWALDYAATSILVLLLSYLMRNPRPVTPALYTLGMTIFLVLDSALPYDSLGPLQAIVPHVLQTVSALVNLTGLGQARAHGNILFLRGDGGAMNLSVFWPSAGVHSILITLLLVITVTIKLRTKWTRIAFYLLIGIFGSVSINMVRITLLALYALGSASDPMAFERFHSVAGELLFLPWILGYLILIVRREMGRTSAPLIQPGRLVSSRS